MLEIKGSIDVKQEGYKLKLLDEMVRQRIDDLVSSDAFKACWNVISLH